MGQIKDTAVSQGCNGVFDGLRDFCENARFMRQIDDVVLGDRYEFSIRSLGQRNQKHAI